MSFKKYKLFQILIIFKTDQNYLLFEIIETFEKYFLLQILYLSLKNTS